MYIQLILFGIRKHLWIIWWAIFIVCLMFSWYCNCRNSWRVLLKVNKLEIFLANVSPNMQKWKISGDQIKLSCFLRFCIRKIWRSGIYPRWCKADCLILLRAGPVLSVNNSLLCLHCFELVKKAWERSVNFWRKKKWIIRKVAWQCFSGSEPVPHELLSLGADIPFSTADVLQPYFHPVQVASPREWVAGSCCCCSYCYASGKGCVRW